MIERKTRIGIIGAGGIARNIHLPVLSEFADAQIEAICDIDKEKADQLARAYGVRHTYALYREMLETETLDAVFVLAQPDQLFRITVDCMEAGLHVLMEKPAGITSYQARTLARKSDDKKAILQVGLNRRYIPLVRHVLSIMKNTELRQVNAYFVKHGDAAFYNGCASAFVCDTIHAIDMLSWLCGGKPVCAATVESTYASNVPNAWNAVMRFENGKAATLQANYSTGGRVHGLSLYGDTVSAYVNLGFGSAKCEADILYHTGGGSFSLASGGADGTRLEHIDGIALAGSDQYTHYYGYYDQDREFLRCVQNGETPLCDIHASVASLEFAEMLLENKI